MIRLHTPPEKIARAVKALGERMDRCAGRVYGGHRGHMPNVECVTCARRIAGLAVEQVHKQIDQHAFSWMAQWHRDVPCPLRLEMPA